MKPRIVIDPGHGGNSNPGACAGGSKEKDIVLACAKMLGHFFRELGYTTVFTRDTDKTLSNSYRSSIAKHGDILISLHSNGSVNKSANGSEIWYRSGVEASKVLSQYVCRSVDALDFFTKRGVKGDKSRYPIWGFYMLRNALANRCKSCILTEVGFISNINDREVLTTTKKRNLIAKAICNGVHKYIQEYLQ